MTDDDQGPYGTARSDMHDYPAIDQVFDVNYPDPLLIEGLDGYLRNTRRVMAGRTAVVSHGREIRLFARENYGRYRELVDRMAELAADGVEFRLCANAVAGAGYTADDMHGFVTVVPAGYAELIHLQAQGYRYVYALPPGDGAGGGSGETAA